MNSSSDISNLFEMAGGSPAQYQEVEGLEQMQGARGRWAALTPDQLDDLTPVPSDLTPEDVLWMQSAVRPVEAANDITDRQEPVIHWAAQDEAADALAAPVVAQPASLPTYVFEPVSDSPQAAPLGSVFARLLDDDEDDGVPAPQRLSS